MGAGTATADERILALETTVAQLEREHRLSGELLHEMNASQQLIVEQLRTQTKWLERLNDVVDQLIVRELER